MKRRVERKMKSNCYVEKRRERCNASLSWDKVWSGEWSNKDVFNVTPTKTSQGSTFVDSTTFTS